MGTETDDSGPRRQTRDKPLTRGLGECWLENGVLCFRRLLSRSRIEIPLRDVYDLRISTCRSGRWAGKAPVVNVVWRRDGHQLSSAFVFSADRAETEAVVDYLRRAVALAGGAMG